MEIKKIYGGKYEVQSDGRVFSYATNFSRPTVKRRELVGGVNSHGYRLMILTYNGVRHTTMIHKLVAKCFIPNPNNLQIVNHKDGNKLNNSVENLEWTTPYENNIHARESGLCRKPEKINMEIANEIRRLYSTGKYFYSELGEMFNIGKTQVGRIVRNKSWVTKDENKINKNTSVKSEIKTYEDGLLRARKIRTIYQDGDYTQEELATMFEIHVTTIRAVIKNRRWCE